MVSYLIIRCFIKPVFFQEQCNMLPVTKESHLRNKLLLLQVRILVTKASFFFISYITPFLKKKVALS